MIAANGYGHTSTTTIIAYPTRSAVSDSSNPMAAAKAADEPCPFTPPDHTPLRSAAFAGIGARNTDRPEIDGWPVTPKARLPPQPKSTARPSGAGVRNPAGAAFPSTRKGLLAWPSPTTNQRPVSPDGSSSG